VKLRVNSDYFGNMVKIMLCNGDADFFCGVRNEDLYNSLKILAQKRSILFTYIRNELTAFYVLEWLYTRSAIVFKPILISDSDIRVLIIISCSLIISRKFISCVSHIAAKVKRVTGISDLEITGKEMLVHFFNHLP